MPPSPPLDDFPSSPASAWSCIGSPSPCSATQDRLSPPTPLSCFLPTPTIFTPDEFTLHILPQPLSPSPKAESCFSSEDDTNKVQVFLRNRNRWGNICESSPALRLHNTPRVRPVSRDSTTGAFSWEATHSALVDPSELPNSSRYSHLIHEVSLLVGLTPDDDDLSPDNVCAPVPDGLPDILPLSLPPVKSLASRKHKNASLSRPTDTNVQVDLSSIPTSPTIDSASASLHNEKPLPVRSGDLVTPIARHKSADAVRPSLSPRRRQGQVFHMESPPRNAHRQDAVDLDETFSHPREPPPKPTLTPPANRCSSLDRLEYSLRKLEAHAPGKHRKSQSEGRPSDHHVVQQKHKRPSLPPPRRLKKQQSAHEIMRSNRSRPVIDYHFSCSPPPSRPVPLRHCVEGTRPAVPSDDKPREEDHTPGSFMDMDIPFAESTSQKRQSSFRQVTSKEKMKSLVNVAKRLSRGVIAWGKNLTGSTKPSVTRQETTTVHDAYV